VEVQAIGSCLLTQFLNPLLNERSDAYGGDRFRRRRLLLDVLDAAAEPWDGRRVGVRLSPYWTVGDFFDAGESTLADIDELVGELNDRPLAYLHLRGPDWSVPLPADLDVFTRYRRLFDGPIIVNNGFDEATGNAAIEAGVADAVSYGRLFIANPDLVTRFAMGHEPAAGDPATFYTGGAGGYVDYPYVDWRDDGAGRARDKY
jgi:N-ethylmaleimide reductase